MFYKLYDIYTQNDKKILTASAEICADFMGFANKQSFYDYIKKSKDEKMMCNNGFYAKVSSVKPETKTKEVTDTIKVTLNKNLLVPQNMNNGLKKLIKIKKGTTYKWDRRIDGEGNILLAKVVRDDGEIRKYYNVLKLKRKNLDTYFIVTNSN